MFARDSSVKPTACQLLCRGAKRKPPLSEEAPVRAEESLVPLEKGDSPQCGEMSRSDKGDGSVRDVTVGDRGIRRGRCPHRPALFKKVNHLTVGANIVRPKASLEKGGGAQRRRDLVKLSTHTAPPSPTKNQLHNPAKKSGLPLDKPEKIVYHKNRKSTSETVCSHC